jgi:hypothetical protein
MTTVIILQSVFVYNDFQNPLCFLPGTENATVDTTLLNIESQFTSQCGSMPQGPANTRVMLTNRECQPAEAPFGQRTSRRGLTSPVRTAQGRSVRSCRRKSPLCRRP